MYQWTTFISTEAAMRWLTVLAVTTWGNINLTKGDEVGAEQVGIIVGQVVEYHLTGCHVMLLTVAPNSAVFSAIRR